MWVCVYVSLIFFSLGIGARAFTGFCKSHVALCHPWSAMLSSRCHTYKEYKPDLAQILSWGRHTHISAVTGVPRLCLLLGMSPPFPSRARRTCSPSQGQPRGNMMPSGPLFQICSHCSDVSACLCLHFSTSAPPSYGKGMRDNGCVCRARVRHEGLQTKGYRDSHVPNSSSAHPLRKRKWLGPHHSEPFSTGPCMTASNTHTQRDTFPSCF